MSTLLLLVHISHWLAAFALWSVAAYCLSLRQKPIVTALFVFCFLSGLWALLSALIVIVPDLSTKVLLNRWKLVSPVLIPSSVLAIAIHIKVPKLWHKIVFFLSAIIPTISIVLLASSDTHELLIGNYGITTLYGRDYLSFQNGAWFGIHSINSRVIVLSVIIALTAVAREFSPRHRLRVILIVMALVIPFIADSIAVYFLPFLRVVQITPTLLLLSAFFLIIGIARNHFVDVIPLAHDFVLNNTNDIYLIFDADDRLVDFNSVAEKEFQIARALLGKNLKSSKNAPELLASIVHYSFEEPLEIPIHEEYFEFVKNECTDDKGYCHGFVIVGRNVTHRVKNEKVLKSLNDIHARILAVVSHDFTGNIASSILMAQSALRSKDKRSHDDLIACISNLETLSRQNAIFVEELLEWSKQSFGMNVDRVKVNLGELAGEIRGFCQYQADEKRVEIVQEVMGRTEVEMDRASFRTVARNLLGNAIEASPAGSKVYLKIVAEMNVIRLEVKDEGRGIDEKRLPEIFNLNKDHSRGLGLFLCREFVARMKGTIEVESRLGVGSQFKVAVPIR